MIERRTLLQLAAAGIGVTLVGACFGRRARHRRRVRRRVRRRIRRRIRRHVVWRTVGPRRLLVVPTAVAVGWELRIDARTVVVHEVRPDVLIVVDAGGAREEIAIHREDTPDNSAEQQGSQLSASDTTTPARETEEEVEEEVEE